MVNEMLVLFYGSRVRKYINSTTIYLLQPRFFINGGGTYNNRENYAVGYNAGLGSLLWRSKNKDMSLGASITGSGNKARYGPYK